MKFSRLAASALLMLAEARAGAQGSVTGTVYDSLRTRTPLANATVVLVERSKYATTDARGHFRFDSVPDGRYTLGFMHPMLDSLDLEAPTVPVAVASAREATVTLTTPSAASAMALMCPGVRDAESGVIIGRVRDVDDGSSLASATVSTDWTEFTVTNGKSDSHRVSAGIKTKANGSYLLCGVPIKVPLEVQAEWIGRVVGPLPVQVDDRLISLIEFAVSKSDSAASGALLRDSTAVALRATASLRGFVRGADGKPLRDATVSLAGIARSARTDNKGAFVLDHIPAGTRSVETKSIGLLPTRSSIDFATNTVRDTVFVLTRTAQELKAVAVKAKPGMSPQMERSGFEEHRAQALGAFMTEDDLSKHNYSDLISVLQGVRGLHVERGAVSRSEHGIAQPIVFMKGVVSLQGVQPGQNCLPNFFVDGSQFPIRPETQYTDFASLSATVFPSTIRGVEIYSNPGTVPAQYDLFSSTGCGSIVIWTR